MVDAAHRSIESRSNIQYLEIDCERDKRRGREREEKKKAEIEFNTWEYRQANPQVSAQQRNGTYLR